MAESDTKRLFKKGELVLVEVWEAPGETKIYPGVVDKYLGLLTSSAGRIKNEEPKHKYEVRTDFGTVVHVQDKLTKYMPGEIHG